MRHAITLQKDHSVWELLPPPLQGASWEDLPGSEVTPWPGAAAPRGGITIGCLHPLLRVAKQEPFRSQYCIFIKVNLLLSSAAGLPDPICGLSASTQQCHPWRGLGTARMKTKNSRKNQLLLVPSETTSTLRN